MLSSQGNQDIKTFLKKFEGIESYILTNFNTRYKAHNLRVYDSHISFKDKFGTEVLLSISEIKQITEVKNGS